MKRASGNIWIFLGRHATPAAGMWVYGRNLAVEISKFTKALSLDVTFVVGGPKSVTDDLRSVISEGNGSSIVEWSTDKASRKLGLVLDLFARAPEGTLVHGMANFIPLFGGMKRIITIHDLLQAFPPVHPATRYERLRAAYYRFAIPAMLSRVDRVLVVHPQVARAIKESGWAEAPIDVVYSPLDSHFLSGSIGDPGTSVLAFVSSDRRKNLDGILKGFKIAAGKSRRLVIVAGSEIMKVEVERAAKELEIGEQVTVLTGVSPSALPQLYREAKVVLFPSFAEGFGYPIYEGLSQGALVVCNSSFLIPELDRVASDLVYGCDVASSISIGEALDRAIRSTPSYEVRLSASRLTRDLLSPIRAADKVVSIYRELLGV